MKIEEVTLRIRYNDDDPGRNPPRLWLWDEILDMIHDNSLSSFSEAERDMIETVRVVGFREINGG